MSVSPIISTAQPGQASAPLGPRTLLAVAPLRVQADSVSFGADKPSSPPSFPEKTGWGEVLKEAGKNLFFTLPQNILKPMKWVEATQHGLHKVRTNFKSDMGWAAISAAISFFIVHVFSFSSFLFMPAFSFGFGFLASMMKPDPKK